MLMRVVTDFDAFDIGILGIVFLIITIICLPESITSVDLFAICQYHTHNFNIRLSAYEFCMPASLV